MQAEGAAQPITTPKPCKIMQESASTRLRLLQSVHVFNIQTVQTALANGLGRLEELEYDGLIRRGRGVIVILDREGLAAAACDFYGVPEAGMRRVMPARSPI